MTEPDPTPVRPRLPDLSLPPLSGGDAVALRAHRQAAVLALLDGSAAERDLDYLRELAAAAPALGGWDGRVLVVVEGEGAAVRPALEALGLPFPVLVDARRTVAAEAGVDPPALVVADQWGEVHAAASVGPDAPWLPVAEVEAWLRFLAVRCAG